MSLLLEGKRAFITGGTRGIGAAICEIFAREGADVAFSYNSREDLAAATNDKIEGMGASAADRAAIQALGQRSSWILERGSLFKFTRTVMATRLSQP